MTRLNISIISVSGSPSRICPPKKNSLTESWYSVGGPLRCQLFLLINDQGLNSIGRNATDLLTEKYTQETPKRLFFYKTNPSPY